MSKHTNKHWLREKEYISLIKEYDFICVTRYMLYRNTRISEIKEKLNHKFFNEYRGKYKSAPKWYRRMLNRSQRLKSKRSLYKEIGGCDVFYEDNYKDCNWYW